MYVCYCLPGFNIYLSGGTKVFVAIIRLLLDIIYHDLYTYIYYVYNIIFILEQFNIVRKKCIQQVL